MVTTSTSAKSVPWCRYCSNYMTEIYRNLSKKSPTGPTERTPKKPEYLIARSQLTWSGVRWWLGPMESIYSSGEFETSPNTTNQPTWLVNPTNQPTNTSWVLRGFLVEDLKPCSQAPTTKAFAAALAERMQHRSRAKRLGSGDRLRPPRN